jgi:hypothetical protein
VVAGRELPAGHLQATAAGPTIPGGCHSRRRPDLKLWKKDDAEGVPEMTPAASEVGGYGGDRHDKDEGAEKREDEAL